MPTFTPPVADVVPAILPESRGPAFRLFRYFTPRQQGVNVYELSDGSFVQGYPTPENEDTNIPYPWNPNDPGGPYSTVFNTLDGGSGVTDTELEVYVVRVWYGGHSHDIDAATAALLTAAGYGDNIT